MKGYLDPLDKIKQDKITAAMETVELKGKKGGKSKPADKKAAEPAPEKAAAPAKSRPGPRKAGSRPGTGRPKTGGPRRGPPSRAEAEPAAVTYYVMQPCLLFNRQPSLRRRSLVEPSLVVVPCHPLLTTLRHQTWKQLQSKRRLVLYCQPM